MTVSKHRYSVLLQMALAFCVVCGSLFLAGCSNGSSAAANKGDDLSRFESAESLLLEIWNKEETEAKPSIIGGLSDEISEDAPQAIEISDPETVAGMLNVPPALVEQSKDGACMMNAMMANAFTVSAWQLKSDANTAALTSEAEAAIRDTHWMCTFPEEYQIATSGRFMIIAYGYTDQITPFMTALKEVMPEAKISGNPIE